MNIVPHNSNLYPTIVSDPSLNNTKRISLTAPLSQIVKDGKARAGQYVFDDIVLGDNFDSLVLNYRWTAIEFMGDALVQRVHDPESPEYRGIKARERQRNYKHGKECLVYIPSLDDYGTFHFGGQTTRRTGETLLTKQTSVQFGEFNKVTEGLDPITDLDKFSTAYHGGFIERPVRWGVEVDKNVVVRKGTPDETKVDIYRPTFTYLTPEFMTNKYKLPSPEKILEQMTVFANPTPVLPSVQTSNQEASR